MAGAGVKEIKNVEITTTGRTLSAGSLSLTKTAIL